MRDTQHLSNSLRLIAAELDHRRLALSANIVREAAAVIASADTHPKGGDAKQEASDADRK